jgi:hypothetical protein
MLRLLPPLRSAVLSLSLSMFRLAGDSLGIRRFYRREGFQSSNSPAKNRRNRLGTHKIAEIFKPFPAVTGGNMINQHKCLNFPLVWPSQGIIKLF